MIQRAIMLLTILAPYPLTLANVDKLAILSID